MNDNKPGTVGTDSVRDIGYAAGMAAEKPEAVDVVVTDEGSMWVFELRREAAHQWVEQYLELEPWQWLGHSFAVDWRLAEDIVQGMLYDGLVVDGS